MMKLRLNLIVLFSAALFASGCSENGESAGPGQQTSSHDHDHTNGHDHGADLGDAHMHPIEGPHHGHLVELGNEEFHAELVHNKSSVTIYVLDAAAKSAVAIEATEVVINLKRDGQPEQFKLTASAEATDPAGKASRFVLESEELVGLLEKPESEARLSITINGAPYSGSLAHDHDDHKH